MNQDWTIQTSQLGKKFSSSLKRSMYYGVTDSLARLAGMSKSQGNLRKGEFWALQNVNFSLQAGEALGVMGVNGSGKSTLLRILNGTYSPDTGEVQIRGRVSALIAAGAGFSPMLSGRENIFVSGALLGLNKQQILDRMESIIDFADVRDAIDMPVKHYSSGMFVRLGFAIAAMVEPEILLVDEVLAVGDLNFQKRCFDYVLKLKKQGTSILLVSHSVGAIWSLCDRGLLLHKGQLEFVGPTEEVIRRYEERNAQVARDQMRSEPRVGEEVLPADYSGMKGGTGDVHIREVRMVDGRGEIRSEFAYGEDIFIESVIDVNSPIEEPLFRYTIDASHYRFITSLDSYEDDMPLNVVTPGRYRLKTQISQPNLMPGAYRLNACVTKKSLYAHLFFWNNVSAFQIHHPRDRFFYSEPSAVMKLNNSMQIERMP